MLCQHAMLLQCLLKSSWFPLLQWSLSYGVAQTVAVEGLARLMFSGRITESTLLSRLLILYFNPVTEAIPCLRYVFALCSSVMVMHTVPLITCASISYLVNCSDCSIAGPRQAATMPRSVLSCIRILIVSKSNAFCRGTC